MKTLTLTTINCTGNVGIFKLSARNREVFVILDANKFKHIQPGGKIIFDHIQCIDMITDELKNTDDICKLINDNAFFADYLFDGKFSDTILTNIFIINPLDREGDRLMVAENEVRNVLGYIDYMIRRPARTNEWYENLRNLTRRVVKNFLWSERYLHATFDELNDIIEDVRN